MQQATYSIGRLTSNNAAWDIVSEQTWSMGASLRSSRSRDKTHEAEHKLALLSRIGIATLRRLILGTLVDQRAIPAAYGGIATCIRKSLFQRVFEILSHGKARLQATA